MLAGPATARGGSPGMGVAGLISAIREHKTKTFLLCSSKFPMLAGPATAREGSPGIGVAGLNSAIRERRTKLSNTRVQD
jgi:hypothetical protein